MNSIFTKLKTSATLWSVIGGFAMAVVTMVWGEDTTANTIASACMAVIPSAAYIICKFALRIKTADTNGDGKVSLEELAFALNLAAFETSDEAQNVVDAFGNVMDTLIGQIEVSDIEAAENQ